ncbi:MAG: N-formylglutamate amidohydrolase [Acetobacter sp.]|nr:N-formylglutamate amidohydrolase [Acetobacter sp.]
MFEFIAPTKNSRFILTCEHASADIPWEYENLGLSEKELNRHIARDKGAAEVCRFIAKELGCASFLGKYSRLLIDLNRRIGEDELILQESDKTLIPSNLNISEVEKKKRIETFYIPYYAAINGYIDDLIKRKEKPILFSIHSYTPQLRGGSYRPWQAGVLYHKPAMFADYLYQNLQKTSKNVGENVPYDLRKYNTGAAIICGEEKDLDYALIEIRDDEFDNLQKGTEEWGRLLADLMLKY